MISVMTQAHGPCPMARRTPEIELGKVWPPIGGNGP
jgi:hypothetical protein